MWMILFALSAVLLLPAAAIGADSPRSSNHQTASDARAGSGAPQRIVDIARGFSFTVPPGFQPSPELTASNPDIAYAFVLGDPTDDELDIILLIQPLHGTIGPGRLSREGIPPGSGIGLSTTRWQGHEVNMFEVPERVGEVKALTYNVQIPLRPAAIQVMLFGPADRVSELRRLLAAILQNLHGESNLLSTAFPGLSVTSSEHYGRILLGAAIAFIVCGLLLLWFISKYAPRGTVLAIAIGAYIVGASVDEVRVREVKLLAGSLRLFAIGAIILGISDLVRKRRPEARSRAARDALPDAAPPDNSHSPPRRD